MATIKLINKKYKVQIRKKGYPSVSKRFHTLGDARRFAKDLESQMEKGTFEDYSGARGTTLKEILIKYRDEKTVLKKGAREETSTINSLKISVRILTEHDIEHRNLPEYTKGLVITEIANDSPLNYLQVNDIIVEVQKKKITSIKMLNDIVDNVLRSDELNLLIVVYDNRNQRRYLGVKIK